MSWPRWAFVCSKVETEKLAVSATLASCNPGGGSTAKSPPVCPGRQETRVAYSDSALEKPAKTWDTAPWCHEEGGTEGTQICVPAARPPQIANTSASQFS